MRISTLLLASCSLVSVMANCPIYPFLQLVPLPSPLPASIVSALQQMNATLNAQLSLPTLPGYAVSVWYNNAPIASWGGGVADIATGARPDPANSLFRIASNTKLFVTLLTYILESKGYLRLDDPVVMYAPDFKPLNTFDSSNITFRMLASHSSGLPDSIFGYFDWQNITTADVFASLKTTPLQRPTYGMPSYSNLGIALLGHVLAEYVVPVNQRGDIGKLIQTHILTPFGLKNTGYYYTPDVLERMTPGYDSNGDVVPIESLGWAAPCGCMYSSVENIAQFEQIIRATAAGETTQLPLSAAKAREYLQPLYYAPDGSFLIGTPWETLAVDDFVVRTKSGTLTGYATKSAIIPELGLTIAMCYNGNFDDWYTGQAVITNLTAAIAPALQSVLYQLQPPRNPGNTPKDYVGMYMQDLDHTSFANVTMQDGQLLYQMTGDAAPAVMEIVVGDTFRVYYNPTSSDCEHVIMGDVGYGTPVIFQRDSKGNVASFMTINFSGKFSKL